MGCGCGGKNGGGGCGGGGRPEQPASLPDTPFEDAGSSPAPSQASEAPSEQPAAPEEAPKASLSLIASSVRKDFPSVSVNGLPIASEAIAQELQFHPAASREDAIFDACQALVIRELLQQRIQTLGLQVTPAAGESEEEALTRTLLAQEVVMPQADEAACRQYFEQNRSKFASAPLVAARHILLACADDDIDTRSRLREHAESLIAQLTSQPERFAALAAEHSACPSKAQGGALGQLSKGQAVPEFERAIFRLPLGLAAQPIESRYGLHVVMIDQRIEGRLLPFEVVHEAIRNELDQRVWQTAVSQYLRKLVGEAEIAGIQLEAS